MRDDKLAAPFPVPGGAWERWLELTRRDAAEADRLYFESLLPSHIAHLRGVFPATARVDVLVTLVGFSPMVSALVAAFLRPKTILAIGSEEAANSIALLRGFVDRGGLNGTVTCEQTLVKATDVTAVFGAVADALRSGERSAVDITGGKKLMTAAAAQAAWHLNRDACYLESRTYVPELRRPLPGTEELVFLPRRAAVLGI